MTPDPHAGSERETLERGEIASLLHLMLLMHDADKLTRDERQTIRDARDALLAAPSPSEERAARLEQSAVEACEEIRSILGVRPDLPFSDLPGCVEAAEVALKYWYEEAQQSEGRALAPASPSEKTLGERVMDSYREEIAREDRRASPSVEPPQEVEWLDFAKNLRAPAPLVQPEPQPEDTP